MRLYLATARLHSPAATKPAAAAFSSTAVAREEDREKGGAAAGVGEEEEESAPCWLSVCVGVAVAEWGSVAASECG